MTPFEIFDLLTIAVVATVWGVISYAMLRHVVYWTGLGRSLFAFFSMTCLAAVHGTLWRLITGDQQPQWAALLFRVPIFLAGIGILYFFWKYPWPFRSDGVRWMELLGLQAQDVEEG